MAMMILILIGAFLGLNTQPITITAGWSVAALSSVWLIATRARGLMVPSSLLKLILLPFLLLFLGLPGLYQYSFASVGKDVFYFSGPIIYISFGYLAFERLGRWGRILQPLLVVGVSTAMYMLYNLLKNKSLLLSSTSIDNYRGISGTGSFITLIPIVLLVLMRFLRFPGEGLQRSKHLRVIVYIVCSASIFLSLSRTLIILLATGLLFSFRPNRVLKKLIGQHGFGIPLLALVVGAGGYALTQAKVNVLELFLDKLSNSTTEVQVHAYETFEDINVNWRGFEAYRAQKQFDDYTLVQQVFGGGFGTEVNLGFAMYLGGDTSLQFVPILHNGFMYILIKTGIVGMCLYWLFLLQIFVLGIRSIKSPDLDVALTSSILLWTAFVFVLTQGVIAGIYNKGALGPNLFLLGAAFACQTQRIAANAGVAHLQQGLGRMVLA